MLHRFLSDTRGAMATTFAITVPALVLAAGMTADYSRLAGSRARLQDATDAAALAAVRSGITDAAQLATMVRNTIGAQFSPSDAVTLGSVSAVMGTDGLLQVDASATSKSWLLGIIGTTSVQVNAHATAVTGLNSSLELALVLDTTGSMAANDKLTKLKSSATQLVNTFAASGKIGAAKVAVVPFAQYVNVGTANRNAAWLTRSDDYSTTNTTTVPASCTMKKDVVSQTCSMQSVASTNDGVTTYAMKNVCTNTYGTPYQVCTPATVKTTTSTFKWTGCVGSRSQPNNLTDENPAILYPALYNTSCAAPLLPLTTDLAGVNTVIAGLTASGETYAPAGLVWGLNVLSPGEPFAAADYDPDKKKPRKVMVFMTDGVNTKSMASATATTHVGTSRADADTATKKLCETIKGRGIEMYTVALMVDDADAKAMLSSCASDADHFYDASTADALAGVFATIALGFAQPHLVR